MATTAVAFRRGNTTENNEFVGVAGEIVVDLGSKERADDGKSTIRLHIGDNVAGGIKMCRADMLNCNIDSLTSGNLKNESGETVNLLKNNLGNYTAATNLSADSRAEISTRLKKDFALVGEDGATLNTTKLAEEPAKGKALAYADLSNVKKNAIESKVGLDNYAKKDMSNVDTAKLAVDKGSDNLAYADTRNVNTKNLAENRDGVDGNKNLAYADMSNVAKKDLEENVVGKSFDSFENKDNKVTSISALSTNTQYPSAKATYDLLSNSLGDLDFVNRRLENVQDWAMASSTVDMFVYRITEIIDGGGEYTVGATIDTEIEVGSGQKLLIIIDEVDAGGKATRAHLNPENGIQNVNDKITDKKNSGVFQINSEATLAGHLMLTDMTNAEEAIGDNNTHAFVGVDVEYLSEGMNVLGAEQNTSKEGVGAAKFITKDETTAITAEMASEDSNNNGSRIILTPTGAYVNDTETRTVDNNHKIAKVQDIATGITAHNTADNAHANRFNEIQKSIDKKQDKLPALESGKYLTNDGTTLSWGSFPILPALPTEEGTYHLRVKIVDGTPQYTWVLDSLIVVKEDGQ